MDTIPEFGKGQKVMLGSAYLMAAMPIDILLKLLKKNGVGLHPKYIKRALFLIQSGWWSHYLASMEKKKCQHLLAQIKPHKNPVIIVGQWRSGTTFLHQLFNAHPNLAAPTFFHCCYPGSFFFSEPYVRKIVGPFVQGTRPMDQVRAGLSQPHEDEDALFRLSGISPLEHIVWPRSSDFFLQSHPTFLPENQERQQWEKCLTNFVDRVHLDTKKRVVLKNAFHSMRIEALSEIFPDSTFVYIHRNPEKVVPSAISMWKILGTQNGLKNGFRTPTLEQIVETFDRMETQLRADLEKLEDHRKAVVKFEELEADPLQVLGRLFDHIGEGFDEDARFELCNFLDSVRNYKKNTHVLTADQRKFIQKSLEHHYKRLGYC